MALWQNIGGVSTIAPGKTVKWGIVYPPNGKNVGVVVARPNLLQAQINVELVSVEQGVVFRQTSVDEGLPEYHYTVSIRNNGALSFSYNLNIGDWQ